MDQTPNITMPGAQAGDAVWTFGRFALSRSRMQLLDGERPVRVGSRALELLLAMVERAGEVVSRAELLAQVWPSTVVEDSSLRVHMSALRKALGEAPGGNRFIVNIPGHGYCFVGAVKACRPGVFNLPAAGMPKHELILGNSAPVGRESAVADLLRMLASHRMLTIVGPGGMGKSTVAALIARQLAAESGPACIVADLAQVSDGEGVAAAVAAALGLASGSKDDGNALAGAVAQRELVLILDNCEHVADAVAMLSELLLAAPGARVLTTSREPICVDNERVYRLAALDLPPVDASLAQALEASALQLFAARARAHVADFELNATNLPAVMRLCTQLDGIPLAIELAAARVDSLGIEGLASRIDQLLVLLTRGRRTALQRHRTLQGLFDWSYELLDSKDQIVLARLSVFRSGFDLEWAAGICSCLMIDRAAVVDSILSLAVKSLVAVDAGSGAPVYRLLNTTRLYAAARLERSGDEATLRTRHARAMLVRLTEADAALCTLAPLTWTARYGLCAADLQAALEWLLGTSGNLTLAAELCAVAWLPMMSAGRVEQYRQYAHAALARFDQKTHSASGVEIRLLTGLCMISSHCANGADGQGPIHARLEAALALHANHQCSAQALYAMCCWSFSQGDYLQVQSLARRMEALVCSDDDPALGLLGEQFQAQCLHYLGNNAASRAMARRVQEWYPARNAVYYIGQVPRSVSMLALQARALWIDGAPAAASQAVAEALDLAQGEHPLALCQALGLSAIPIALWGGDDRHAAVLLARLRSFAQLHLLGFWRDWAEGFEHALALRTGLTPAAWALPANPKQLDLLGTLAEPLAVERTLMRAEAGAIPWCSAEILRAHGENLLASNVAGARAAAGALFQRAADSAASRGQRAWQLRAAISLARLAQDSAREGDAMACVAAIVHKYDYWAQTTDLTVARTLLAGCPQGGALVLQAA